jgi:hypothetical protein
MLHVLDAARSGHDARVVRPINHDPAASVQPMMDEHAVLGAVHVDDGAIGPLADDVAIAVLRFDAAGRSRMTDEGSRLNRMPRGLVADKRRQAGRIGCIGRAVGSGRRGAVGGRGNHRRTLSVDGGRGQRGPLLSIGVGGCRDALGRGGIGRRRGYGRAGHVDGGRRSRRRWRCLLGSGAERHQHPTQRRHPDGETGAAVGSSALSL